MIAQLGPAAVTLAAVLNKQFGLPLGAILANSRRQWKALSVLLT
jgi:hypothetical protein